MVMFLCIRCCGIVSAPCDATDSSIADLVHTSPKSGLLTLIAGARIPLRLRTSGATSAEMPSGSDSNRRMLWQPMSKCPALQR